MKFQTYVRKPFTLEAIEVTVENMAELAPMIGELQHKADGTPFILVNKKLVPNIEKVWPGHFMTRLGKDKFGNDNIRCYSRRIFRDQFMELTEASQALVDAVDGLEAEQERESAEVNGA